MLVVVGADLGRGTGASPSCLSGINVRTGEKVFEWVDAHTDVQKVAYVACALCWMFQSDMGMPAKMIWEKQGPGANFGKKVEELGFRNFYMTEDDNPVGASKAPKPGWQSSAEKNDALLEDYRSALALRQMTNRSEVALRECLDFKYDKSGHMVHSRLLSLDDPSGARTNHGDRVVADALAWKLANGQQVTTAKAREPEILEGSLAWRRQLRKNAERQLEKWA